LKGELGLARLANNPQYNEAGEHTMMQPIQFNFAGLSPDFGERAPDGDFACIIRSIDTKPNKDPTKPPVNHIQVELLQDILGKKEHAGQKVMLYFSTDNQPDPKTGRASLGAKHHLAMMRSVGYPAAALNGQVQITEAHIIGRQGFLHIETVKDDDGKDDQRKNFLTPEKWAEMQRNEQAKAAGGVAPAAGQVAGQVPAFQLAPAGAVATGAQQPALALAPGPAPANGSVAQPAVPAPAGTLNLDALASTIPQAPR